MVPVAYIAALASKLRQKAAQRGTIMPVAEERRKFLGILAAVAALPAFKMAVASIKELTIATSGVGYVRPTTSSTMSLWLGQGAAALDADTMQDIQQRVQHAAQLVHPLSSLGSRLPQDVQDAIRWVVSNRHAVPAMRQARLCHSGSSRYTHIPCVYFLLLWCNNH